MKHKFICGNAFLLAVFSLLSLLPGCTKEEREAPYTDQGFLAFTGEATFGQMVPAPANPSVGKATFSGRFDNNSKVFNYEITWDSLSGPVPAANFYFPSDAVQNGLLVRNIVTAATPLAASGFLRGQIWGNNALSASEVEDLKAGKVYFIINTQANTAGELRGKITLKP